MFVVMNVTQVAPERAAEFEEAFLTRERHLNKAEGFAGFELLKDDKGGEYVVLTRWESREAFQGWVSSDAFKASHKPREGGPIAHGNELRTCEVLDTEAPVT